MWIATHVKREKKKTPVQIRRSYWVGGIKSSMQQHNTHTDSLCKLQESFLFHVAQIYTKRIITHSEVSFPQHKLHKGHSNWFISSMLLSFCTFLLAFLQIFIKSLLSEFYSALAAAQCY